MILPHDPSNCFDKQNLNKTSLVSKPPSSSVTKVPAKSWRVRMLLEVEIEVPLQDAAAPAEAIVYARELSVKLPLKVTLGNVPLPAKFLPLQIPE
jgi:hypothetical protein